MSAILRVDGVTVDVPVAGELRRLIHAASFEIGAGEILGLVGESGSGKSLTTRAIMGLLPRGSEVGGRIAVDGAEVSAMSREELRLFRADRIGMIFQTPRAHLNPLRTIGDFLTEALVTLRGMSRHEADRRAVELLDEVGIADGPRRLRQRPGELSGGLLQRVMIASALAMDPKVLLADEITTALDVTTQEEVMAILQELRRERGLAMLFITHDLTLASAVCDRVCVMQAGTTIETLGATTMAEDARTDYTRLLLAANPTFEPPAARESAEVDEPLVAVRNLAKTYRVRAASGFGYETLTAVQDVSFALERGGALGIVGESGSGKSTVARVICGLESADSGAVEVAGEPWTAVARLSTAERRRRARVVQMVFQDPYQSLDRRQSIRQGLTEVIALHNPGLDRGGREARVLQLLDQVRLDPSFANTRPRSLSGGQRQRVAIARALAANPQVLVLDEAVSALDVTIQAEILRLLARLRRETGVALLFISHDLSVIAELCDDVIVMRHGRIEEAGTVARVLGAPEADYTKALINSVPRAGWIPRRRRNATPTSPGATL